MDRNVKWQQGEVSYGKVALRKESVDRNNDACEIIFYIFSSLSARRAWIEIIFFRAARFPVRGRSPQGERG